MKNFYLTTINQRTKHLVWLLGLLFFLPGISYAQLEYSFVNSSSTYQEVVPDEVITFVVAAWDDEGTLDRPIGFPFVFGGEVENNYRIAANGFISFVSNGSAATTTAGNVLNTAAAATFKGISGHNMDLVRGANGELGVKTLGTAPNRILVVQWKNVQVYAAATSYLFNFQIRIHETTNIAEVIYGNYTLEATALARTCQVGIRAGVVANTMAVTTAANWNSATTTAVPTTTMPISTVASPTTGQKYGFIPVPPAANDLAISGFIEIPSGAVICDSTSLYPGIVVRNRGANAATPNLLVTVTQGGNLISTQPVIGSTIAASGFDTLYFTSPVLLPTLGVYNLTVNLLGSDDVALNDTLRSNINVNRNCSDLDYTFAQSNEVYVPITGGTNVMPLATSNNGLITLPFSISFAGSLYNQINAHRRGFVLFGNRTNFATNLQMAVNGVGTENGVFMFGANHTLRSVSAFKYITRGTAPNREVVIQWDSLFAINPLGRNTDTIFSQGQMIITERGRIRFHYGNNTFTGNSYYHVPVSVGIKLNDSTFQARESFLGINNWSNTTEGKNIFSTVKTGVTSAPVPNGTVFDFFPPPPPTNDIGLLGFGGFPILSITTMCDSVGVKPFVIIANTASNANTGFAVRMYVTNNLTNTVIDSVDATYSSILEPFIIDTLFMPIYRLANLGGYRFSFRLVNAGDQVSFNNNLVNATPYTVTRNCSAPNFVRSATLGTYEPISTTGTPVIVPLANNVNQVINIALPFNFRFVGKVMGRVVINRHGYIGLRKNNLTTTGYTTTANILNGLGDSVLAPMNLVQWLNGANSSRVDTAVLGVAPNRVFVVQWSNMDVSNLPLADSANLNYQVRLYEENNKIEFAYGDNFYFNAPGSVARTVQAGIKVNVNNFYAEEMFLDQTDWATSLRGYSNNAQERLNNGNAPQSGLILGYTPPVLTNDLLVDAVNGMPTATANLCDSTTFRPTVVVGNNSSVLAVGVTVKLRIFNNTTGLVIDSIQVNNTDIIDPLSTISINLPAYRPGTPGVYRFQVVISAPGDQDIINNVFNIPNNYTIVRNCILPGYTFSNTAGLYEPINTLGAALMQPPANNINQANNIALPINFSFQRNRVGRVIVNRHGYIVFRRSITTTTGVTATNNVLGTVAAGLDSSVIAFNAIQSGNSLGTSRVDTATITVGTERAFVIQWSNMDVSSIPATDSANLNYQIRLFEGSNRIEVVYGPSFYTGTIRTVQSGLRLNFSSFYNNEIFAEQDNWQDAQRAYSNFASMRIGTGVIPNDGMIFGYTPIIYNRDLGLNVPTFTIPTTMCGNSVFTQTLTVNNTGIQSVVDGRIATRFILNATNAILTTDTVNVPVILPGETAAVTFNLPTPPTTAGMRIEMTLLNDDDLNNNFLGLTGIATIACRDIPYRFVQDNSAYDELPVAVRSASLGAVNNDNTFINATMPFNFPFGGRFPRTARISPNGYVALRTSAAVAGETGPMSTAGTGASDSLITAFGFDQLVAPLDTFSSNVRTGVLGNAPNRVFVVQWFNNRAYSTTSAARDSVAANYQVRMWENGPIQLSYGAFTGNFDPSLPIFPVQAGVRFRDTVHSFRTNAGSGSASWNNTANRNGLGSSVRYLNGNDRPENGLNYFYVPNGEVDNTDKSITAIASGSPCVGTSLPIRAAITAAGFAPRQVGTLTFRVISPTGVVTNGSTDVQTYLTGGRTDTSLVANFTFTESGSHRIIVRGNFVGDNITANDADTITIIVRTPTATPTITASGSTAICQGQSITLTAPDGASYLWSNGATTRSITVNDANSYTVAYSSFTNPCLSLPSAPTVTTITPLAQAGFTTAISLLNVTVTNTATNATSYNYSWTGGTSTSANPVITFAAPGNYTIRQIATSVCGADTIDVPVSVNGPTDMSVTLNSTVQIGCVGSSLNYNGVITNTSAFSGLVTRVIYSVTDPNGVTVLDSVNLPNTPVVQGTPLTLPTRTLALTTTGTYVVGIAFRASNDITPANNFITSNFGAQPITPTPTITVVTGAICSGAPAVLSAPENAVAYLWSNGETTRTINITTPGAYTVQIRNTDACISAASASVSIANAVVPTAGFISSVSGRTVTVANTATGGGVINYFINTNTTPVLTTSNGAFDAPAGLDEFDLVQIITNACGADTSSERILSANIVLESATKLYPNPTTGKLNVSFGALQFNNAVITITDLTGKVVLSATSGSATELNLSKLPSAMYTLRVSVDGSAPAFFQVVKQ
jgi:hypothetical protein